MISLLASVVALGLVSPLRAAPCGCYADNAIDVDVAIIGGGSAGIYAATRLGDYNKSVVVLEAKGQIGGHAETYYDPTTGAPVNMGVAIFTNTTTITNYLKRYNVPLTKFELASTAATPGYNVNFATGEQITTLSTYSAEAQGLALATWGAQLAKYPGIAFGYNLTYPIDEDLLMPFGQYAEKYNLTAAMHTIYSYNQGFVQLLEIPALYMLKYFGAYQLQSFQDGFFWVSGTGDTRTLYKNAAAEIGSKILYNVSGMQVTRSNEGVTINVGNSSSGQKLVRAKKLIFAVPPTLQKLQQAGFDLDQSETEIFGKLYANAYYSLLLKNSGIETHSLSGYDTSKPFDVPTFPSIYQVGATTTIPSLAQVFYASPTYQDIETVKADVVASISRVSSSLRSNSTATPEVVYSVQHTPFNPMVPVEDIKDGYYTKLEAQQGQKSTWYIGGAWATASSSTIWEGLEQAFLPQFLATF